MCKQCVPGSPSSSPAQEPGNEATYKCAKEGGGALLSVSAFNYKTEECPCHVCSDSMPSKQII